MSVSVYFGIVVLGFCLFSVGALPNGLGLTPQMGYSSWMDTSSSVNETRIKYIANQIISKGFDKLGYIHVNVDEGWLKGRDPTTQLMVYDNVKFPSGMKALGDYIHSLGLKYGLYTTRGTVQCGTSQYQNVPGSYGHYKSDMAQMAGWGMDYVKVDSCGASQDHNTAFDEYGQIRDALNATGRKVFFSLCGWYSWYAPVGWSLGNSWRIAGDGDSWSDLLNIMNTNVQLYPYAKAGGWNDADLLIGNGAGSYGPDRGGWYITDLQSRTQFSVWSVMSAPLLISADLGSVSQYALDTWSNSEVIAINQDVGRSGFSVQGIRLAGNNFPLSGSGETNVWGKALSNGSWGVVFVNNEANTVNVTCDSSCFAQMKFSPGGFITIRDLYLHQTVDKIPVSQASYTATSVLGSGGSRIFTFTPTANAFLEGSF